MKRHLFIAFLTLVLVACSEDEGAIAPRLTSPATANYNASCQTDIRFDASTHWTATSDADWMTLVQEEGTGQGRLPIYLEQNDAEQTRHATVTITFDDKERSTLKVQITQRIPSENGTAYVDLPKNFGLGWGYDMKADIADVSGLRGQIFNGADLNRKYGEDAIYVNNSTGSDLYMASGNSHEEMQNNMGATFAGSADILIASAKVSVEYSNQIKEKKDRRYVWCRTTKAVKMAGFGYPVDMANKSLVRYCTTQAFRDAVNTDSPEDIVRKFGTHLVTTAELGGKLDYYFTVSQTVKTEVERIITHINVKVLFIKKSWTEVDEKTWTEIKRDFQARYQVTGGGQIGQTLNAKLKACGEQNIPLDDPTLFEKWDACFVNPNTANPDNLTMIACNVIPIWEVIETINANKAKAIEEYVMGTYLKK